MSDIHVDISGIKAAYGKQEVLHGISFQVRAGETFGLIGLNGAGKTTLLKIMLGLKEAKSGSILLGGLPAGAPSARRNFAFLPERFDPAWFLSAYEFIKFTLSLYGRAASRDEIDSMAEKLALKKAFLSKRAHTYSKGMRQKLGLMATFLTGCPLLLLDEPMSGLDPLARAQVKNLVANARAAGRTVFFSSHILSDMHELCDRVAVLHGGNIVFTGTPADILVQTGQETLERAFLHLIGADNIQEAA